MSLDEIKIILGDYNFKPKTIIYEYDRENRADSKNRIKYIQKKKFDNDDYLNLKKLLEKKIKKKYICNYFNITYSTLKKYELHLKSDCFKDKGETLEPLTTPLV